jgi:hypothetical protein
MRFDIVPGLFKEFYGWVTEPILTCQDIHDDFLIKFFADENYEDWDIISIKLNPETLEFVAMNIDGVQVVSSCKLSDALDFINNLDDQGGLPCKK